MNVLAMLSQTEYWTTKSGETVKVRTMSRAHKQSLLDLLRVEAGELTDQVIGAVISGTLGNAPLGTHAGMTATAIIDEIEAVSPLDWVNAQPLLRKLDADVNILAGLRRTKIGAPVPTFG